MSEFPEAPEVQEKRNNTPFIIIGVVIVLMLLCCCAAVFGANALFGIRSTSGALPLFDREWNINREFVPSFGQVEASHTLEDTVDDISTPVTIEVDNQVGEVRILGADIDTVQVTANVRAWGSNSAQAQENLDRVRVTVDRVANDHVRVAGSFPQGLFQQRSPTVQITIRMPREAVLDASTNVGEIRVENLLGDANVRTNVGEINVENVEGALNLRTDVGDVRVRNWTMTGDSRLETNVGPVRVTMRAEAFSLDAQSNVGDIESQFEVDGESERRVPGERLVGAVGENPQMELVVRTGTGEIILDRAR